MILDYSYYITREGSKGILSRNTQNKNLELFYSKTGVCPFCKVNNKSKEVSKNKNTYPDWLDRSFSEYEDVFQCPTCGWWKHIYRNSSDAMLEYTRLSELKIHISILRQYNLNSKEISIQVLNNYIKENLYEIYGIHHKK